MKVYLGADHRGFALKEKIKAWLLTQGREVTDLGNTVYDPNDDYPDFAFAVAETVVADSGSRGIVICGSGVGVTIAANKIGGARCSTGVSPEEVKRGREDDDLNILAISADYTDAEKTKALITAFLTTAFAGDERHVRRLNKIKARETRYS